MCYRLKNIRAITQNELDLLLSKDGLKHGRLYHRLLSGVDSGGEVPRRRPPGRLHVDVASLAIEAYRRGIIDDDEVERLGSKVDVKHLLRFAKAAVQNS